MNAGTRSKRRVLGLAAAFCLALLPPVALAQKPPKVWRIGLCHVGLDHEPPGLHSLHTALTTMGYIDGENLRWDWRNQPDAAAADAQVRKWVADRVDLIVAFEEQCVAAAKAATATIPIVFVQIYDPQAAGFIQSLSRPGGNMTGPVANLRLLDKRLQIFKEIDPKAERILVLYDATDPLAEGERALAREAAGPLKLTLVERAAGSEAQLKALFAGLKPGEVDAVIVASPNLQTNHPKLIIKLSKEARLPVIGHREAWVDWGALVSYSSDSEAAGPMAARYIDKIFKGAKPADLPVEEVSRTMLVVNFERAKELGLTVPVSIELRTDRTVP